MKTGFAATLIVGAMLALSAPAAWAQGPESVAPLAKQLSPAVVNIGTSRMIDGSGMPFPEAPEGDLSRFRDCVDRIFSIILTSLDRDNIRHQNGSNHNKRKQRDP